MHACVCSSQPYAVLKRLKKRRKKRAPVCRSFVVPSNREAQGPAIKTSWKLHFPPPPHFLWVWAEALWCKSKRIRALFVSPSLYGDCASAQCTEMTKRRGWPRPLARRQQRDRPVMERSKIWFPDSVSPSAVAHLAEFQHTKVLPAGLNKSFTVAE